MEPTVLCDLDGVVWLAGEAIPGSPDAVAALRRAGRRVLFVTNNSFTPVAETERRLARIGVPAQGDVLTSAQAAARLVTPGERVLLCAGPGVEQELERRGAEVVTRGRIDVVLVGLLRTFDYEVLTRAADAVRGGARLIGTNDDATYPTPVGRIPGGGAILAAVAVAAETQPVVAGKPHQPMADLVRERLGVSADQPLDAVMVGDRASTDGLFAQRLGVPYAHVWSGVSAPGAAVAPTPAYTGADLAAIAALLGAEV